MSRRSNTDGDILLFVGLILMCIVAMPLVGLYMIFKKNGNPLLGVALVIIGFVLWGLYLS